MSSFSSLPRRATFAAATIASLTLLLAGCSGDPSELIATPSASAAAPSPTASGSASAPPPVVATATAKPDASPVDIACDSLVSNQVIYDYNPNFGAKPSYTPVNGTLPASAAGLDGVSCAWVNESSGELIEIAVAKPDESTLASLQSEADSTSAETSIYGTPPQLTGYFAIAGAAGEAQVFTAEYWVIIRSDYFIEARDAGPLMEAAISALP